MIGWPLALGATVGGAAVGAVFGWVGLRRIGMDRWIVPYMFSSAKRRAPTPDEPIHFILAVCDHYEPKRGNASPELARARVQQWVDEYPRLYDRFRDVDGRPPQHSFFYPADEYEPELVDMIAGLCRRGFGEMEIHLHHDNDTADNLRKTLIDFKTTLHERHGVLTKDPNTGEILYGFIHGNWALDNSRRDGRHCGVNNELEVLRETGCYADFTLPSSPSDTQTQKINSIYWAVDDPCRPRSHNTGLDVGAFSKPPNALLMVQGPLILDWSRRKFGLIPKVENSCLQANQPPTMSRLNLWLKASVTPANNPNWYFAKLHTHGVSEPNQDVLLGDAMINFHEELAARAREFPNFRVHYVTARQMANLALAPKSPEGPTETLKNSPYPNPFG